MAYKVTDGEAVWLTIGKKYHKMFLDYKNGLGGNDEADRNRFKDS